MGLFHALLEKSTVARDLCVSWVSSVSGVLCTVQRMVEVSEIWTLVSCIFQALWPGSRCLWPARPTSRSASASACAQRSWKGGKGGGQVYNCVKWVADVVLILLLAFFRDFFWKCFCHEVFAKLRVLDGSGFRMANSDRGPSICQEAGPNARRRNLLHSYRHFGSHSCISKKYQKFGKFGGM